MRRLFGIAIVLCTCGLTACGQADIDTPTPEEQQRAQANGTTVDLAWLDQIDGVADPTDPNPDTTEQGNAVDVDAAGNVYIAGWTSGALPGQTSARRPDAFVRKYDRGGDLVWTRQLQLGEIEMATGIAVDTTGVYVTGSSLFGSARFGNITDTFVRKYTHSGDEVWTRRFDIDDSAHVAANGIALDASGVYVAGEVGASSSGRVDPEPLDAFVRKFNRDGDTLWTDRFGSAQSDRAEAVATNASGVFIAGSTEGALTGATSNGGVDAFVRSYSRLGAVSWTRQFGTAEDDEALGIGAVDNEIYVGGFTEGVLRSQTAIGARDAMAAKFNSAGTRMWTRQFGTADDDTVTGVDADASGAYLTGTTGGAFDGFDSAGATDVFAHKRSPEGDPMWTFQFGTSERDFANDIAADAPRVDIAGTTEGAFPGFANPEASDAFVAQLREEDTTPPPAECEVFEGDLIINSPADTAQTDSFDGCFDVTGGVYVQDTSGITDLSFLSGLRSVGTFLAISDNADLVSLDGLDDLERVDIGLVIEGNARLEAATSMTSLRRVEGPMHIFGNPALERIDFPALEHAGTLVVGGNDALVSLDMCALEFAGLLHIENNDVLAGFCFDALSQVDGRFRIAYNHALPTCAAEALLQDVGPANVRGPLTIEGNDDSGICP